MVPIGLRTQCMLLIVLRLKENQHFTVRFGEGQGGGLSIQFSNWILNTFVQFPKSGISKKFRNFRTEL